MAATLLNGVNEVLKKMSLVNTDQGVLTTLSDSSRQTYIDAAVVSWNEAIEELYSTINRPLPKQLATANITLSTNVRDSAISSFVTLYFPFINQTTGDEIVEYPGGWLKMQQDQTIPANYTGKPQAAALDPTNNKVYFDRIPTATENGAVYAYWYDKELVLTVAASTFPFNDTIYRAMVPVVANLTNRTLRRDFDQGAYSLGLGRASRLLSGLQIRDNYRAREYASAGYSPFDG